MTIYSERVELVSLARRLSYFSILLLLLGVVWLAYQKWGLSWHLDDLIVLGIELLVAVAFGVNQTLAGYLSIQLTERTLTLRAGLVRRRIPLGRLLEAKVFPHGRVTPPSFWTQMGLPSFVSLVVRPQLELHISGGESVYISTQHPDYLAGLIKRESKRAFREETLGLVQEHHNVDTKPS